MRRSLDFNEPGTTAECCAIFAFFGFNWSFNGITYPPNGENYVVTLSSGFVLVPGSYPISPRQE
jgi:hypothetical protein